MVLTQDRYGLYWTVEVDGEAVPSGTTLFNPTTVAAIEERAAVHLVGGRLLHLQPETEVRIERLPWGAVRLEVSRGIVTYLDERSETRRARAGDKVVILDDQSPASNAS
jgi:hypothetical protein